MSFNPTGKGGFRDNPSNRNNKGRPLKGYSITEQFREMLSATPQVKEAISKVILKKALDGDMAAIKLIWQYMDGLPQQSVNANIGIDESIVNNPKIANTLIQSFTQMMENIQEDGNES